jgi:alpha-methylacyl-CoA racemase
MAGVGPAPFGVMLLADLGADVVRIDRPAPVLGAGSADKDLPPDRKTDPVRYITHRGRRSVVLDLKSEPGRHTALALVAAADVLVEGYRPGVMERLGLGPDTCLARNSRLVYARMTGWGQDGPLAHTAGHDINYIAVAGALNGIRRAGERPLPPMNLVADMGGGGMLIAFGIVAALLERSWSGQGQVIDAAMVDGVAVQLSTVLAMTAQGRWHDPPGTNFADTGAPYYEVYETADGGHVAVGAIEEPFYEELLAHAGIDPTTIPPRDDPARWIEGKDVLAKVFRTRTRDEWTAIYERTDACVTPVLSLTEAPDHPHLTARQTYLRRDAVTQPAPAPRFSRSVPTLPAPPPLIGEHTDEVLREWGVQPS